MKYSMLENVTVDLGHIHMRKVEPFFGLRRREWGIFEALAFHTIVLLSQRGVHPVTCVLGFAA